MADAKRPTGGGPAEGRQPGDAHESDAEQPSSDAASLARDWITLCQSELAALAVDREAQEAWHTMLSLWAGAAGAMLQSAPRGWNGFAGWDPMGGAGADGASRRAGPPAAARPPAAGAAPDPRDAEIERLGGRLSELESRLAQLEQGSGGGARKQPRRTRKRVVPDGGA